MVSKQQLMILFLTCATLSLAVIANQAAILDPLVSTGVSAISPEGKHVAVNVPAIFHMTLDTRGNNSGARLSESILSGFVKIDLDRTRGADGKLHGPVKVAVGGVTMYDNGEPAPSA